MEVYKRGVFWYQVDEETGEVVRKTRYRPNPMTLEVVPPTVAQAVDMLDDDNDEHWTKAGLPAMAAVEGLVQHADITRRDVRAANPRVRRVPDGDC